MFCVFKNSYSGVCALETRSESGLAAACGLQASEGVWDVDSSP